MASQTSIAPQAALSLAVHSTHTPGEAQAGVAAGHALALSPGTHTSQVFVLVSQAGVAALAAPHSALVVQPAHSCVLGSQWGAAGVRQSRKLSTQATHMRVLTSHAGSPGVALPAPQSARSRQGAQLPRNGSQRGVSA